MEVKSVYMDLQEGFKKGNVWKLESEAFKKPIEIKIGYDNHELAEFQKETLWLKGQLENHDKQMAQFLDTQNGNNKVFDKVAKQYNETKLALDITDEKIQNQNKEISSLWKVIAEQKTTIEILSSTILQLQEAVKLIDKKLTKQPTVIHDKGFISGHESSGLGMINIPDGDYLLIAKYVVGEHNEYVLNQDEILFDKIHVEGQHYVPFYKLEGGTDLDTPTATIYYDLVFMPL